MRNSIELRMCLWTVGFGRRMILAAYRERRNFSAAVPPRNVHHQGAIARRSLCDLELRARQWRERGRATAGGRSPETSPEMEGSREGREGEPRWEIDLRSRRRRRRAAERKGRQGELGAGERWAAKRESRGGREVSGVIAKDGELGREGGRGRVRDRDGRRETRRSSPKTEGSREERGERERDLRSHRRRRRATERRGARGRARAGERWAAKRRGARGRAGAGERSPETESWGGRAGEGEQEIRAGEGRRVGRHQRQRAAERRGARGRAEAGERSPETSPETEGGRQRFDARREGESSTD